MTHAPYYPLADRTAQWFSNDVPTHGATNRGIVWHTTEMGVAGEPWPTYTYEGQAGGSAPHFTVKPDRAGKRLLWRQHWRADEPARALAHPPGTPATNNTGVLQVELGGTAVPGDPGYFWPHADDWALQGLADFARWAHDEWGIPLTDEGRRWVALRRVGAKDVDQTGAPSRLSWHDWANARGHLGHEHVPGNDHIDPGDLPVARILTFAEQGDDTTTDDSVRKIVREELAAALTSVAEAVWGAHWGSETAGERLLAASRRPDADAIKKAVGEALAAGAAHPHP